MSRSSVSLCSIAVFFNLFELILCQISYNRSAQKDVYSLLKKSLPLPKVAASDLAAICFSPSFLSAHRNHEIGALYNPRYIESAPALFCCQRTHPGLPTTSNISLLSRTLSRCTRAPFLDPAYKSFSELRLQTVSGTLFFQERSEVDTDYESDLISFKEKAGLTETLHQQNIALSST